MREASRWMEISEVEAGRGREWRESEENQEDCMSWWSWKRVGMVDQRRR